MNNLKYLKYIAVHKFYVFREGMKLGVPIWRLVTHDLSKFSKAEWGPYKDWFYNRSSNPNTQNKQKQLFMNAWRHHCRNNPHHWNYWCQDGVALEMPNSYRAEMIADWRAMGYAQKGYDDCNQYYKNNRTKITLHPETRRIVEREIGYAVS